MRRLSILACTSAVAAAALALAGCGGEGNGASGPRPVSGAEAQRMALARFRAYEQSPAEVTVHLPGTATVRAVVDHRTHRAVGAYEAAGAHGILAWDLGGLAVASPSATATVRSAEQAVEQAGSLSPTSWTRRAYTAAPLDRALRLILSVAADRPDNAQLLSQSGSLWLRNDRIGGREYGVFSGPRPRPKASAAHQGPSATSRSPLTYWVDEQGEMSRITAQVTADHTATIDLGKRESHVELPDKPWTTHH